MEGRDFRDLSTVRKSENTNEDETIPVRIRRSKREIK
jgi:hypothetical protein